MTGRCSIPLPRITVPDAEAEKKDDMPKKVAPTMLDGHSKPSVHTAGGVLLGVRLDNKAPVYPRLFPAFIAARNYRIKKRSSVHKMASARHSDFDLVSARNYSHFIDLCLVLGSVS